MRRIFATTTMLVLCGGIALAAQPAAAPPGWMAGCWISEEGDTWTEECWTASRAGSMLGSGRVGKGAALQSWETMQILGGPDGVTYWAAPGGVGRTRFAMVSATATEVVFANPAHDYPQRIRYWRDGATLNAEVSLADGSKPMRWSFRRQG